MLQLHVFKKYIHFLFLIATYNTYLAMPIKISNECLLSTQPLDTGWKTVVHELKRNQTCHKIITVVLEVTIVVLEESYLCDMFY